MTPAEPPAGAGGRATPEPATRPPVHGSVGLGLHRLRLPWLLTVPTLPGAAASGSVLGFDVGGTKVRAAIADLSGQVIDEVVEPTEADQAEELAKQLVQISARLLSNRTGSLLAAAVGCPGVLDPDTGGIGLSPNAPAVEGTGLRRHLEDRLGVRVDVDNDVNLSAVGERWHGAAHACRDFVFVNLGTGIGAALVLDGDVYQGRHGGAGEIAHLPLDLTGLAPPDRRAAFERAVAPSGMLERHLHAAGTDAHLSSAALLEAAADGGAAAREALNEEARLLAGAIGTMVAVIDPELVVLGGGFGSNPVLAAALHSALSGTVFPVTLQPGALAGREGVLGAVLLALGAATSTPSTGRPQGNAP